MEKRPDTFSVSHPFELSALVNALYVAAPRANDGGITRDLYRRAAACLDAADTRDRARQLEGHRAAND